MQYGGRRFVNIHLFAGSRAEGVAVSRSLSPLVPGLVAVLAAAPVTVPIRSQEAPAAEFGETLLVHEVELEVVATARDAPVTELGADDFEVYEDGESREIRQVRALFAPPVASVAAAAGRPRRPPAAAASPDEPLYVVHAFEPGGLSYPQLVRVTGQVRDWVAGHATPGLRQAVALLGPEPLLVQPYTEDVDAAVRALGRVPELALGRAVNLPYDARLVFAPRGLAPTRGDVLAARRPSPGGGRRLGSEGGGRVAEDLTPAQQAEIDRRSDWERSPTPLEKLIDDAGLRMEVRRQRRVLGGLEQLFGALGTTTGSKALIYYFSSAAPPPHRNVHEADRVVLVAALTGMWDELADRAAAAGFRVYGSDLRGFGAAFFGTGPSAVPNRQIALRPQEAAGLMAHRTGGRAWGSNEQGDVVARAVEDYRATYRVRVVVPHPHDGREHRWEVRTGRAGVSLRYARRSFDLSPRDLLLSQLRTPSTLPKRGGTLPVRIRVSGRTPGDGRLRVRLEAGVLADRVGLVPAADGVRAGALEVFVATYSAAGTPLSLDAKRESFRVRGAAGPAAGAAFAVHREVDLPAAGGTVAVGFYDAVDGGTALAAVLVRPPPPGPAPVP